MQSAVFCKKQRFFAFIQPCIPDPLKIFSVSNTFYAGSSDWSKKNE